MNAGRSGTRGRAGPRALAHSASPHSRIGPPTRLRQVPIRVADSTSLPVPGADKAVPRPSTRGRNWAFYRIITMPPDRGPEVANSARRAGFDHGFRLINGRLVRFGTQNACDRHADCLSELLNVLRDRANLLRRGWSYCPLRTLQNNMVCGAALGFAPRNGRCRKRGQRARNAAVPGCHSRPGNACPAAGRRAPKFLQPRPQPRRQTFRYPSRSPFPMRRRWCRKPNRRPSDAAVSETDEIENFAARRRRLQARRKQARRSSRWTALILVLFAFNVALIGARSEVVRYSSADRLAVCCHRIAGQPAQPEI